MKLPLRLRAGITFTTSQVVSFKVEMVDDEGLVVSTFYGDMDSIDQKIEQAREDIQYIEKMFDKLNELDVDSIIT